MLRISCLLETLLKFMRRLWQGGARPTLEEIDAHNSLANAFVCLHNVFDWGIIPESMFRVYNELLAIQVCGWYQLMPQYRDSIAAIGNSIKKDRRRIDRRLTKYIKISLNLIPKL